MALTQEEIEIMDRITGGNYVPTPSEPQKTNNKSNDTTLSDKDIADMDRIVGYKPVEDTQEEAISTSQYPDISTSSWLGSFDIIFGLLYFILLFTSLLILGFNNEKYKKWIIISFVVLTFICFITMGIDAAIQGELSNYISTTGSFSIYLLLLIVFIWIVPALLLSLLIKKIFKRKIAKGWCVLIFFFSTTVSAVVTSLLGIDWQYGVGLFWKYFSYSSVLSIIFDILPKKEISFNENEEKLNKAEKESFIGIFLKNIIKLYKKIVKYILAFIEKYKKEWFKYTLLIFLAVIAIALLKIAFD